MKKPRRRRLPPGFWPAKTGKKNALLEPAGLALAVAVIVALLMPQQVPFPYRFEKGHPWNYPTLKAPFDFEVLYPEERVREQLDRINAEHAPYYLLHPEIGRQQKRYLANLVTEQARISRNDTQFEDLVRNQSAYITFGQNLLEIIYAQGLGGPKLTELYRDNPNAPIYLVDGKTEQRITASSLLTVQKAEDFITDTLPFSRLRQPELLLPILEKALIPNILYNDSLTTAGKRQKIAAVVSTGITVRKGEVIVQRNDLITDDIYLKLDSLSRRFDVPKGVRVVAGYALLAFLVFGLFFFWLQGNYASIWQNRLLRLSLPVIVVSTISLVTFSCWIGPAVALLIPIWGLPILLDRTHGSTISRLTWAIIILLTAFSLDWSAAWLALQLAGITGVLLIHTRASGWPTRGIAAFATAFLQTLVWLASLLAGKIPAGLQTAEVILFLLAANGLLLLIYPLKRSFELLFTPEKGA